MRTQITGLQMITRDDIEGFLDRLASEGATYREIEPGLWAVRPGGALDLDFIVHHNPPVVVLRVKVMDLPATNGRSADLNRRLLELNASDLVHGSYGISNESIVLTEALELEHLDYEEFQSSYESMTLALATHVRELATFREDS
ncbi:MAG TPA: YbjN domain-containing protein [Gemmatimonadaceae bacterium]